MEKIIKNRRQFSIHIFIWAILYSVILFLLYSEGKEITLKICLRIAFGAVVFYTNYSLLVPHLLLKKKKIPYLLTVVVLLMIAYLVISNVFVFDLYDSRNLLDKRPSKFIIIIFFNAVIIIIGTIIRVYEQWIENDRIKTKIEVQKNKTELESLKNQLNPHFLFNSLNSIYSLTVKKSNDAPEAVIMLSELMRYMLYKANDNKVLLKDELQYIENYIKLQRIRIAKNENVKMNIRGAITTQKISPLLFISYIENAFKYGTDFKGNTEVEIDIGVKEDELQFKCINIIGSVAKDQENSGIGMQNTKNRLELLYPGKHWLTTVEKDNKFIVDLKLKLD
ncbi:sensor histidine kinase [Winogradskyella sp. PG-2]|uniref:sensor histidine kinase n=1 Tax=Winogradskyella sp. PG-2 TaxID=754409 RepID=UPI0004588937|nr:sensor histidine kinase [Winogradskyella sp. PG-2]BAO77378.1 signaling protein without kinase domain [Winogradskyella sp. PG-2]